MRVWLLAAAALTVAGCSTVWPHGERVVSRDGDTFVVETVRDPQRPPPVYKQASAYCAGRGKVALLTNSRLDPFKIVIDTYVCQVVETGR